MVFSAENRLVSPPSDQIVSPHNIYINLSDDVVRSFVLGESDVRTDADGRTASVRTAVRPDVGLLGRTGGQTPDGRTAQCEKRSPRPNKINTTIVDTTSIDGSTALRSVRTMSAPSIGS